MPILPQELYDTTPNLFHIVYPFLVQVGTLKLLFGDLEEDHNIFLNEVVDLHNTRYCIPKGLDKLNVISQRGIKDEIPYKRYKKMKGKVSEYEEKRFQALYWKNQDFIFRNGKLTKVP